MEYENRRYINPLNDFGFKHLFGNAQHKDVLIDFLNQLFIGEKEIVDLIYSPTERAGDKEELKKILFDLLCTGKDGEQFIIEMQRDKQRNFKDRAVFYTSRLINEQLLKGKSHWNIDLKEVYFIGILDFCLKDSDPDHYLHDVSLTYNGTGENFYDKLFYKFIELPKFDKESSELETDLDKWLYLLKHMSRLEKVPAVLNKDIFQRVFEIAEIVNLNKEEKNMFDFGIRAEWDYKNVMDYATETAREKGIQEGEHKNSLNIASEMKKEGIDIASIIKFTKLSVEEIENL